LNQNKQDPLLYLISITSTTMAAPAERHELTLDPAYDHYDFPTIAPAPQSGHPGYTTEMQEAQVAQLRMMLEQAGYKDNLDTLTLVCCGVDLASLELRY
jgi:hypothetical protein